MNDEDYQPSLPIRLMLLEQELNGCLEAFEAREQVKAAAMRLYRHAGRPRISVILDERSYR